MEMGENVKPDIEYPNAAMPETFNFGFISKRVAEVFSNKPEVWAKIRHEYADVKRIYLAYLLELIALPFLVGFLFLPFQQPVGNFLRLIVTSIVLYIFICASIYVSALLVVKIASKYGCSLDIVSVLKLLAYTSTPVLVAVAFLSIIDFVALLKEFIIFAAFVYSAHLLYSAISILLDVQEKENRDALWALVFVIAFFTFLVFYDLGMSIANSIAPVKIIVQ